MTVNSHFGLSNEGRQGKNIGKLWLGYG